ncbi:MAG: hypothetical protein RUMPE_01110 [Eubacteriales bacterium SKADARSKE-1]|nr:hypothetical protein [Eubacteriales bacterium SKADARSKE-1]
MLNKAFKIIEEKVFESLSKKGFQKNKLGTSILFSNKDIIYKIEFDNNRKQFCLSSCSVPEDGSSSKDFSIISVWLFDPSVDTEKEAKSIAADFLETLEGPKQKVKLQSSSKKTNEQNNTNLIFFINRLITTFPELKDDIKNEKDAYEEFRGISFIRESVLPHVKKLLDSNQKSEKLKKLCTTLNNSYSNANLDVRSAITIVILNSIDDEKNRSFIEPLLSEDLKRAWKAAQKYKDKVVKPEKVKKKKSFLAKTLETASKQQ